MLDRRGERAALSDHRPLTAIWSTRAPTPAHRRPIPEWVAQSAIYAHEVTSRLREAGLDQLPLTDALRRTKQIMRASGAKARNDIITRDPRAKLSKRHAALQVTRALHRRDIRSLKRVMNETPELAELIIIDSQTKEIDIVDDDKLHRTLAAAIRGGNAEEAAQQDGAETNDTKPGRRARANTRMVKDKIMRRWAGLWAPHRQRRWLSGIMVQTTDNGEGRDGRQGDRQSVGEILGRTLRDAGDGQPTGGSDCTDVCATAALAAMAGAPTQRCESRVASGETHLRRT